MKELRIGVIGLGFIGPQHIEAIRRIPSASVVALCSSNEEKVQAAGLRWHVDKTYTDWRDLIADSDIDVIHNCTPHAMHDQINRAAILSDKHIYSEKPLSLSAAEARKVWELAVQAGVAHGLNHQYRMNAVVQEMRARLQHGLCGKQLMTHGYYMQESASRQADWNHKMENTGIARALNDIGIHWVDTACFVLGQPVREVIADLSTHYPIRTDTHGSEHMMNTEDTTMILMHFRDGTPGQLIASKAANGYKNDLRLNIECENYSMAWRQEEPDTLIIGEKEVGWTREFMNQRTCQRETLPYISTPMGHVMGWSDALRNAIQSFYDSILNRTYTHPEQPYSTFLDGFQGMAFVEACIRSHRERRWVEVEQI